MIKKLLSFFTKKKPERELIIEFDADNLKITGPIYGWTVKNGPFIITNGVAISDIDDAKNPVRFDGELTIIDCVSNVIKRGVIKRG